MNEEKFENNVTRGYVNDQVKHYLASIGDMPTMTAEEEVELAKKIEAGDMQAKEQFIMYNLKLVVKISKLFSNRVNSQLTFMDIIQEGNRGLFQAVEKFDYRLGNKFSTYAAWWIKQTIRILIDNNKRELTMASHAEQKLNRINYTRNTYIEDFGVEPNSDTLFNCVLKTGLEINKEEFIDLIMLKNMVSIEQPVGEDDNTLADVIEDKNSNFQASLLKQLSKDRAMVAIIDIIKNSKSDFESRDLEIFLLKHGLIDSKTRTLSELSDLYDLSRERIRQIIAKAYRKIKNVVTSNSDFYEYNNIEYDNIIDILCLYANKNNLTDSMNNYDATEIVTRRESNKIKSKIK